jgi:hypothetical protein
LGAPAAANRGIPLRLQHLAPMILTTLSRQKAPMNAPTEGRFSKVNRQFKLYQFTASDNMPWRSWKLTRFRSLEMTPQVHGDVWGVAPRLLAFLSAGVDRRGLRNYKCEIGKCGRREEVSTV